MFEKIKEWFFYREFTTKRRKDTSNQISVNFERSICILFDGTDENDRKSVYKFKKLLNNTENKIIKSLAFIDNSLPLDNVDYAAYNHKNIKWTGVPFGEKVDEFVNYNFDLLIVLCKKMLPHFEYIISHSAALFVVGPDLNKSEKYFNLIIENNNDENINQLCQSIIKGIDKISIK